MTGDVMLREIWAVSLVVRWAAVAVEFRNRNVSHVWLIWAAFYAVTGTILRACDYYHGPYLQLWLIQQVGFIALWIWLVIDTFRPTDTLVIASALIAVSTGAAIQQALNWPDNPMVEIMTQLFGVAILWLAIISAIGALARPRNANRTLLALYTVATATLMLAAPDYLSSAGLGRAWGVMDTLAFGAWTVVWTRQRIAGSS
jgi:hypothetical protein